MFTGLVEKVGKVLKCDHQLVSSPSQIVSIEIWCGNDFLGDVKVGDSICVQGACLTVTEIGQDSFTVDLSPETLDRTNFKTVTPGKQVNLEKSMMANGRFGGHLVQGHVDCTAIVEKSEFESGDNGKTTQWLTIGGLDSPRHLALVVEKGFICVNGISLTICSVDVQTGSFTLMLIPHTQNHISAMEKGTLVNLEFDIMGKYILHQRQVFTSCSQ